MSVGDWFKIIKTGVDIYTENEEVNYKDFKHQNKKNRDRAKKEHGKDRKLAKELSKKERETLNKCFAELIEKVGEGNGAIVSAIYTGLENLLIGLRENDNLNFEGLVKTLTQNDLMQLYATLDLQDLFESTFNQQLMQTFELNQDEQTKVLIAINEHGFIGALSQFLQTMSPERIAGYDATRKELHELITDAKDLDTLKIMTKAGYNINSLADTVFHIKTNIEPYLKYAKYAAYALMAYNLLSPIVTAMYSVYYGNRGKEMAAH